MLQARLELVEALVLPERQEPVVSVLAEVSVQLVQRELQVLQARLELELSR